MRIEGATKIRGMTRRCLSFGGITCEPDSKPFEAWEQESLLEMSPANPRDYFWLEVTKGGGNKEVWYSDKTVWRKAKSIKEAEELSEMKEGVEEYVAKRAQNRADYERGLSMNRGQLSQAFAVATEDEKRALAAELAPYLKDGTES